MAEGISPELVKQMKKNMENEDHNLENEVEMVDAEEETSDDDDSDYDPENDHNQGHGENHQMMDSNEVMNGIRDLKRFMTQKFDAQDMKFQKVNRRFDAQDHQIQEMRDSIQI